MCSCFSQHQQLKIISMERLLFMDVKIIAFELPIQKPQEQRSRIAKQLFEERQLKLRDMVADADKDEFSYDDIISDITELFLSGEKIERNPESLGSSSKSLTTSYVESWKLETWNELAFAQCCR